MRKSKDKLLILLYRTPLNGFKSNNLSQKPDFLKIKYIQFLKRVLYTYFD